MSEIKLSLRQIEIMRHAIGLGNEKLKKSRYDAYRNRYVVTDPNTEWEYLIGIGYAGNSEFQIGGNVVYYVTDSGIEYLSSLFGLTITMDD